MTPKDQREQFRAAVLAWDGAHAEPRQANRLFDRQHELAKTMRETEAGRSAIADLLDDPVAAVRLCAATYVLQWRPDRARPVLEALTNEPSLHAVSAKWTLRSYEAGTLDLDW